MITQKKLKELFTYEEGHLYWKEDQNSKCRAGDKAGSLKKHGYIQIRIKGRGYYAHRLIFLFFKGYLPKYIDHRLGDKKDNRIENLRECTHSQNHANIKPKSGFKGVSFRPKYGNWLCRIGVKNKTICLGTYSTAEEAAKIYNQAALKHFGEFAKLNQL